MSITPFEVYKLYIAVSNHFQQNSYDYFKYNGKVNANSNTFDTRKDKYMFYKLSKHEDPLTLLVSNLSEKPKMWIGDLFELNAQLTYNDYLRRKQSLTYIFQSDIDNMLEDFDSNFKVEDGDYPHLLKLLTRKKITKETFIIIQDCVRFFGSWNKKISDPVLWPSIAMNCKKFRPFMEYEKTKYCDILRNKFS